MLDKEPGKASKITSKSIRSTLIYILNNHVEKGICRNAVEERWSFLAYAFSSHPFSEPINKQSASRTLIKATHMIDRRLSKLKGLEYADLDKIMPRLNPIEREQFIDYVISRYKWIDFSYAVHQFGSLDKVVMAADSTSGSEYAIREDYSKEKDTGYISLVKYASAQKFLERVFTMSGSEKLRHIAEARIKTSATDNQLRKFFHYNFTAKR